MRPRRARRATYEALNTALGRARAFATLAVVWAMLAGSAVVAAEPPALVKARALYNAADYDGAISAAAAARRQPGAPGAAALVLARAHLERYRQRADPADLAAAREALGSVRLNALSPRDRVDLLIGLGQSLYLGEIFGASAELFDTALTRASLLDDGARLHLLDWWATALDREAQTRPVDRRARIYERIAERMEEELRIDPGSAPANYWRAVAARGAGDTDRAWDAAVAAWVRSNLTRQGAEMLRADLDRLVTQALIPERVRMKPPREQAEHAAALNAEWELVKTQWK